MGAWDSAVPGCYQAGLLENPFGWANERKTREHYTMYSAWYKQRYSLSPEGYRAGQMHWQDSLQQGYLEQYCVEINDNYASMVNWLNLKTQSGTVKAWEENASSPAMPAPPQWINVRIR
jgi:hypothetical protein